MPSIICPCVRRSMAGILAILLVMATCSASAQPQEAEYAEKFKQYYAGQAADPASTPTLEQYATPGHFDSLVMGGIDAQVEIINQNQNKNSEMAWGTAYLTHALNDMAAATGDAKYLRANLMLVRASLANTDRKKGYQTFFGEASPGWGTGQYSAGRWVVHPVHTGIISFGIVEFLRLARQDDALMAELGDDYGRMLADVTAAMDWHDRQWVDGPAADEGHYIFKDNEPGTDGRVKPANRQSSMGRALWALWKVGGNPAHRDKALALARYMKRRLALYQPEDPSQGPAYFWPYDLPIEPVQNPRPWAERLALNEGEDLSHGSLTVSFFADMALEGQIFTAADARALARTCTLGFGRREDGILFGGLVGTGQWGPENVSIQGYFLRLTPLAPEVYDPIAAFMMKYQRSPRNCDLAQLIRFRPEAGKPKQD